MRRLDLVAHEVRVGRRRGRRARRRRRASRARPRSGSGSRAPSRRSRRARGRRGTCCARPRGRPPRTSWTPSERSMSILRAVSACASRAESIRRDASSFERSIRKTRLQRSIASCALPRANASSPCLRNCVMRGSVGPPAPETGRGAAAGATETRGRRRPARAAGGRAGHRRRSAGRERGRGLRAASRPASARFRRGSGRRGRRTGSPPEAGASMGAEAPPATAAASGPARRREGPGPASSRRRGRPGRAAGRADGAAAGNASPRGGGAGFGSGRHLGRARGSLLDGALEAQELREAVDVDGRAAARPCGARRGARAPARSGRPS